MSRPRWYAEHGSISFDVEVGSECHRITWARGRVVLHDHDLEAERVVQALGGEPCPCLSVLDACREPSSNIRRPTHRITLAQAVAKVKGLSAYPAAAKPQQDRMIAMMRQQYVRQMFPDELLAVLSDAWAVRRERRFRRPLPPRQPPDLEQRLQAAVAPACQQGMRRARRDLRAYATFTIECWKRVPDEPLLLKGMLDSTGGTLALSLSADWLNRVWIRGLAVVDGHFVLDVDRPAPATELEASVIR